MKKVALITGAGSGIGRGCALKLLETNEYNVVLTGRRLEPLQETAALAGPQGQENTLIYPADVSQPDQVQALFQACEATYGRLDLLFNNAGRGAPPVPLEETSLEDWNAVVSVNLTGPFLCTRQAFRIMKKQQSGGRIINNGSISAHSPRPNSAAYTATKHAMTGLTKSTALDGRGFGIACGQLDIGNAVTDMTEPLVTKGKAQADGTVRREPRMRLEDVVNAFMYMASLPLSANVQFMTVMATEMPFIGRG